ncbi:MAG: FecR family protein [Rhizobiales bacterium]|nr:FecR family protein [Hyphomicrobiales bacterium]
MTHQPADAPLDPMTEAALSWLVRLHSGEASEQDWSDYQAWKAAGVDQRRAADRAERLWQRLGPALRPKRRSKARGIAVAILLVAGLAGGGFAGGLFGPPGAYFADHRTALGERRTVALADGSTMELDAGTSVDIDFGADRRRLVLHAGQIFVTVTPDPARPFVVQAGRGTTRALGTAFDVRSDGEGARIVVTEHAVRVAYAGAGETATTDVAAGQQVTYAPATGLGRPEPVDTGMLTAWRRGQVIFDGRPLGDVVAELARYRRGRILITDSALRDLPVTGIFSTADADALVDALPAILPVRVWRLPGLAVIQRDPDRPVAPFPRQN